MDAEAALAWIDRVVYAKTGDRLSELAQVIIRQSWHGRTYLDIADTYGCTEGHAKDTGADLWKQLTQLLNERISKKNIRVVIPRLSGTADRPLTSPPQPALHPSDRVDRPTFVGRATAIDHLQTLAQQGHQLIVIQGAGGLGKTTLAQHYLHHCGCEVVLELLMAQESSSISAAESIVEEWLRQEFQEEPGLDFGITLERLKRHLRQRRIGILIDNLEPALNARGQLIMAQRAYRELLRLLADPRNLGLTLVTSRDRLCEPGVTAHHYRLPGLDWVAWQQYFQSQAIVLHTPSLQAMHHAYGGNAKAMRILAGVILEDYGGDLATYWQQHQTDLLAPLDLKNLVDSQLTRLQTLDQQAYRLFCRLGCYRYQDVATVPQAGVCALLWDIPPEQHQAAIVALKNRSLIEVRQGQYSLHPVLRAAAIARLRERDDWQTTHQQAAQFWTRSVAAIHTTEDALRALEAYYHYRAIPDYEQAGRVILNSRDNQWHQYLPLGSTLYRMGLLRPLLTVIPDLLPQVQADPAFCELLNILGDAYWITGQIHAAIDCQAQSLTLSAQALASLTAAPSDRKAHHYYTLLSLDARLSLGLYRLDLWELKAAAQDFTQIIASVKGTRHSRWAEKAQVCLALTLALLGQTASALEQAQAIYDALLCDRQVENRGSFAYFIQLLGQAYIHLQQWDRAQTLLEKTLTFSESSHYTQVKARTLTGMAMIRRQQGDFAAALSAHQQAIALCQDIGAQCDLAEAHYQLGLTYQQYSQIKKAQQHFQGAIHLFTTMNAPQQVHKVYRFSSRLKPVQ